MIESLNCQNDFSRYGGSFFNRVKCVVIQVFLTPCYSFCYIVYQISKIRCNGLACRPCAKPNQSYIMANVHDPCASAAARGATSNIPPTRATWPPSNGLFSVLFLNYSKQSLKPAFDPIHPLIHPSTHSFTHLSNNLLFWKSLPNLAFYVLFNSSS